MDTPPPGWGRVRAGVEYNFPPPLAPLPPREGRFLVKGVMRRQWMVGGEMTRVEFSFIANFTGGKK
jgi:hypothetical protein